MKKYILFVLTVIPFFAFSQLRINEIMPKNVSYVMDESYNYSMWVEIQNFSSSIENLSSYYFTDDKKDLKKWNAPYKWVDPNKFLVLWFEREEREGHANFKLEAEGGKLYLVKNGNTIIDSLKYPAQYRNISYGRRFDGGSEWVFFEQASPGASNNNKLSAVKRCPKPVFSLKNGFYSSARTFNFTAPASGDTIFYTKDGSEPTRNSSRYITGSNINVSATSIFRAKTISYGKLSSDIATSTFFINQRDPGLPVVSIVTDNKNLFDNTIGIYCNGTNGITGNGQTTPRNFNQDWDRPVNFEMFDTTGLSVLNQEVDIKILGGWTRANSLKSLAISPKSKFGDNRLKYDFFAATKPNRKYKDIQMRNSGNDFGNTMMRDAFIQSIIMHRMDLDYLAYEPAVLFINGQYYGIENLRERSSSDYMYSNYGLDDGDVRIIEATNLGVDTDKDIATDPEYLELCQFVKSVDIASTDGYEQVCKKIDVDEFINYMIAEIYIGNTDWPYNNVKMWKVKGIDKWRWIYFDTDFGFDSGRTNHNSLTFALGENSSGIIGGYSIQPEWSVILFKRLLLNETFKNKFIDRFAIHIATTYKPERVNGIMDSISSKISKEITYHKSKWGQYNNFTSTLNSMKSFANARGNNVINHIGSRLVGNTALYSINLSSNIVGSDYLLNNEPVLDNMASIKYFKGRKITLKANPVSGYRFKHWAQEGFAEELLILNNSVWKYYDGNGLPATNWNKPEFNDASWKSGQARLGYGEDALGTTIGFGGNSNNKYPTAYFRKTITISNLDKKSNFKIYTYIDDGAVIYVNGNEIGRPNMSTGLVGFNTLAASGIEGMDFMFEFSKTYLKEGENVISVEVHQNSVSSSDMVFDLKMACTNDNETQTTYSDPLFTTTLNANLSLKAIYEVNNEIPVNKTQVYINEVVSSNNVINDEFGEKDDYIEIYNNSDTAVNIAGWYISDTPANSTLARIPFTDAKKTTIPSKGRIILWADDAPGQGPLHLGFKLNKDGEKLSLSKIDERAILFIVDSVTVPYLEQNLSYSRLYDGCSQWVIQNPTYNISNLINAIKQTKDDIIDIYPTLVTESINVLNATGLDLTITDMTGKTHIRSKCQSDMETIDVGLLNKGVYILKVGNKVTKIVKR
jgi:hypothetical protein